MTKTNEKRPNYKYCKYCGKQLPKRTRLMFVNRGDVPTHFDGGQPVVEILNRKEDQFRPGAAQDTLTVWLGRYGRYGDDMFCGLRCGYWYGLAVAKRKESAL